MTTLLPREIEVLKIIIEDYIAGAATVGSRTVAKQSSLKLSPASMRNVMADLTDKGYLEQPHTSAGRVPTLSAFRFYLDNTLQPAPLTDEEQMRIERHLAAAGVEISVILGQATKLVSGISQQACMILAPSRDDARWREIDFRLIKPGVALAVLVLDGGIIQNKLIAVEDGLTADELQSFSNYLNDHFRGRTLSEARTLIHQELIGARNRLERLYRRALSLARQTFESVQEREIFVTGAVNILDNVSSNDLPKMREVLRLLEERSRLLSLLDKTIAEEGVRITFGQEADMEGLNGCSLVSSPFGEDIGAQGVVGVIGPLRMNYAKVLPVVDYIARTLTHLMKERF